MEPLNVTASHGTLDFPTRVDWDGFFALNSEYNKKNTAERPDTIYIGGLPFEWFKVNFFIYFLKLLKAIKVKLF